MLSFGIFAGCKHFRFSDAPATRGEFRSSSASIEDGKIARTNAGLLGREHRRSYDFNSIRLIPAEISIIQCQQRWNVVSEHDRHNARIVNRDASDGVSHDE